MKLRIHHFYDMIRDYGRKQPIIAHPYGHSYHKIAKLILIDPNDSIELVLSCDAICEGCSCLEDGHCLDKIGHRADFQDKEKFNNHIDERIMKACGLKIGDKVSPKVLIEKTNSYLDKIEWVYEGNDKEHTANRKKYLVKGIEKYRANMA